MKIHGEKQRLSVTGSDISGSVFDDVNLWKELHAGDEAKRA